MLFSKTDFSLRVASSRRLRLLPLFATIAWILWLALYFTNGTSFQVLSLLFSPVLLALLADEIDPLRTPDNGGKRTLISMGVGAAIAAAILSFTLYSGVALVFVLGLVTICAMGIFIVRVGPWAIRLVTRDV
jgi:hypothetical protein